MPLPLVNFLAEKELGLLLSGSPQCGVSCATDPAS